MQGRWLFVGSVEVAVGWIISRKFLEKAEITGFQSRVRMARGVYNECGTWDNQLLELKTISYTKDNHY
jgi:hypothetical protein